LNFTTGAAYAYLGAMPMLMITGQKAIKSARQARFQLVDIVGSMRPITKLTRQIVSADSIPSASGMHSASRPRNGPAPSISNSPRTSPRTAASAALVSAASNRPADCLACGAERAGRFDPRRRAAADHDRRCGQTVRGWWTRLSDFVRKAQIPFFNTQMGKRRGHTGNSELYLGTAALSERDYVHDAIECADLIIAIGHDTVEKPPFLMADDSGPKVAYIGYVSATVEQVFHPDAEVIGDIGTTVSALAAQLQQRVKPAPEFLKLRDEILGHINERAEDGRFSRHSPTSRSRRAQGGA